MHLPKRLAWSLRPASASFAGDLCPSGEIEAELAGLIGKINGRFGDAVWTPIRYVSLSAVASSQVFFHFGLHVRPY